MKRTLIFVAAAMTLGASLASAEETRVGVGVGPVAAGVTVGQSRAMSDAPRSSRSVSLAITLW